MSLINPAPSHIDRETLDAIDMLGELLWLVSIAAIVWFFFFSGEAKAYAQTDADLGASRTEWLIDPYSPIPAQTLEEALDTVLKTRPGDLPRTLETLRPSLYAAAMGSIENWGRTSEFVKNNTFDDACWSVQETQQRLWYELAQFYNNPPRAPFKRRLKRTLRDLIAAERTYLWCWDGFLE